MNNIIKLAKNNGFIHKLNGIGFTRYNFFYIIISSITVLNRIAVNYSSKPNDRCPFNYPQPDLVSRIRAERTAEKRSKASPVFYTGPLPSEKSICEERRIKKCLLHQEEYDCVVDPSKCEGLAPDCSILPNKEVPGRVPVKNIPGAPKTGWERFKKKT